MIMNVSGTVCQLIHYFPCKQGLAINLLWPALKSEQCICIEFFTSSAVNWTPMGGGGGQVNLFYCCIYNITTQDLVTYY